MAFRISRRALQSAIAQAIAIAQAAQRRATARQTWRDSITGTVTVRIRDAAGTLKATVTRTQPQAGDWATLNADSATFNWVGTTSVVASAGNPPSTAPWWTMHFEDATGEFAVMTVGSRASTGADYKLDPLKVGVPVRLRNLVFATNPALADTGGGSLPDPLLAPTISASPLNATTIRVSGVPAGAAATAVRVYRKSASGGARTLVGTITPPATYIDDTGRTTGAQVWYDATSTDGTSESGYSAEKSATAQAVTATLVTTMQVRNAGDASTASPIAQFVPQFKRGDVPSGSVLEVRKADGVTVVPSQQDAESTWLVGSDVGSLSGAVLTIKPDDTLGAYAANDVKTYQIWRKPGSPDRAPNVTLTQLAATSDFKIRLYDADSPDVFEVSLNDLIANGVPQWNPTADYGWGQNPTRGYEIIRSGPLKTEYKFWAMIKRVADGALHKWVKARLWVRCYGSGRFEAMASVEYTGVVGPKAGATVGANVDPTAWLTPVTLARAQLLNGSTVIHEVGGATDPRVSTGQSSDVLTVNGTLNPDYPQEQTKGYLTLTTATPGKELETGVAVRFAPNAGSTLPAPLIGNKTYWLYHNSRNGGGIRFSLHTAHGSTTDRLPVWPVDLTDQGSGSFTATPVIVLYYRSGFWLCGPSGLPSQVGFAQPEILCAHDATYLTRESKATLPYRLSVPVTASALNGGVYYRDNNAGVEYWPGCVYKITYYKNFSATSDDNGDERIGWMNQNETIALVYRPLDRDFRARNRFASLWWIEHHNIYDDEASGRPVNVSNNDYPGLKPKRPLLYADNRGDHSTHLIRNPADHSGWSAFPRNYLDDHDGSHRPGNSFGAYLLSGDDWHLDCQINNNIALDAANDRKLQWMGSDPDFVSVHCGPWTNQGLRAIAWCMARMFQAYVSCPDSHPMRNYFKDRINVAFKAMTYYFNRPGYSSALRRMGYLDNTDWGFNFQIGMLHMAINPFRARGEFPLAEPYMDAWLRRVGWNVLDADATDEHPTTPTHGCLSQIGAYFVQVRVNNVFDQSWQQTWDRNWGWRNNGTFVCPTTTTAWGDPLPANGGGANTYSIIQLAGMGAGAFAGDTQALKLFNRTTAMFPQLSAATFANYPRYAVDKA